MTTALGDLARMENIIRGSDVRPSGEWWKNHIPSQHGDKRANVALLDDHLNLCEALRFKDASKWEDIMQEEYDLLLTSNI